MPNSRKKSLRVATQPAAAIFWKLGSQIQEKDHLLYFLGE
jgi:hypothetical protein